MQSGEGKPVRETQYAQWFQTYIAHCDENQRQAEAVAALVSGLKERVPHLFESVDHESLLLVDVMSGPGDMTRAYKKSLQLVTHGSVRATGVELRLDHCRRWNEMLDPGDIVYNGDVAAPDFDLARAIGLSDSRGAALVTLGHGGYYLHTTDTAEGLDPLKRVIHQMHSVLSPFGIAIALHKDCEWTDVLKRRFGRIVESDTTLIIHRIYSDLSISHRQFTIGCRLVVPHMDNSTKARLTAEQLERYSAMEKGPARECRELLEFLIHTPLENLGCTSKKDSNYLERQRLVKCFESIVSAFAGRIPTYVNIMVSVSPQADPSLAKAVMSATDDICAELGDVPPTPVDLKRLEESVI